MLNRPEFTGKEGFRQRGVRLGQPAMLTQGRGAAGIWDRRKWTRMASGIGAGRVPDTPVDCRRHRGRQRAVRLGCPGDAGPASGG